MGKLQEFLMKEYVVPNETHEVPVSGFPEPFLVKTIRQEDEKELRKSCMKPVRGKGRRMEKELDADLYGTRLVTTCCVDPNFDNAELQKKFGVAGSESLLGKILDPGQFYQLLEGVQEVNHITGINEDIEEVKNSSPGAETTV